MTLENPPTAARALAAPTLCAAFQIIVQAEGDNPALCSYGVDDTVTWREFGARVEAVATGLAALGVVPDQTVALLLRNGPTFNVADAGILHVGAVPYSIYHTEPVEQMLAQVLDAGTRVLITEPRFLERALAVAARTDQLEYIVVDGDAVPGADRVLTLAGLEALPAPRGFDFEGAWRAVTGESVATLVYTSGTTGAPKAVQIPHRAVMNSLAGVEALAPSRHAHLGLSFLPNAHITDRFICHYTTLAQGGTLVSVPDPDRLWDALADVRPTRFFGVPRTFEKLMDRAQALMSAEPELDAAALRERLGLDRVEWLPVAAAPSSLAVLEFHHSIGLNVAELWGQSEFMMAIMNPTNRVKLGTVGIPLPNVEARLADDGELLLRGPNAFLGYRNDAERTLETLDAEGWVHSGDLAAIDADGYFKIVGRKKEQMINSSGKNLVPAKIEAAILEASPLLGYVAAIGDRRRFVGALIVLDPDALLAFAAERGLAGTHAELCRHDAVLAEVERAVSEGNARLSRVEQVRSWRVLDVVWTPGTVEVTNTVKLRRAAIDEKYAAEIEALYAG